MDPEKRNRVARAKAEMEEKEIDALLVTKPTNIFYLSGFNGIWVSKPEISLLMLDSEPVLIVPHLWLTRAQEMSWAKDILPYGDSDDPFDFVRSILEDRKVDGKSIGIEEDFLTVDSHSKLAKKLPEADLVNSSEILRKVRMIKDKDEIGSIKIAAEIVDEGMLAAVEAVKQRRSEAEICATAESGMKEMWAKHYPQIEICDFVGPESGVYQALSCSVNSGPKIASPTAYGPTGRKVETGDLVQVKLFAVCNGYHAENERSMAVGKPTDKQAKGFKTMLEARRKAGEVMRPGATCSQVARAAKEVFQDAGYMDALRARAGHGIGLGSHEIPSLREEDKTVLQENMVMCLEPALYAKDECEVRFSHSDTLVITKAGREFLTEYDRGFLIVQ